MEKKLHESVVGMQGSLAQHVMNALRRQYFHTLLETRARVIFLLILRNSYFPVLFYITKYKSPFSFFLIYFLALAKIFFFHASIFAPHLFSHYLFSSISCFRSSSLFNKLLTSLIPQRFRVAAQSAASNLTSQAHFSISI